MRQKVMDMVAVRLESAQETRSEGRGKMHQEPMGNESSMPGSTTRSPAVVKPAAAGQSTMAERKDPSPRGSSRGGFGAATPDVRTMLLDGVPTPYTVRTSARARHVSLRVSPGKGVEVVLPRGVAVAQGEALLRTKAQWVRRALERMQAAPDQPHQPDLPPLFSGRTLSCASEQLTLRLAIGAPSGRFRATRQGTTLDLTLHALDEATVRAALSAWYRRQASAVFAERLQACNSFGFAYHRVTIKEQKSRWGSCSRAGNLNFNWRLLLAPLPVLDYVVIHELAHLREHNHGPRFWALVASACPQFREHRRWLKLHGHELRF